MQNMMQSIRRIIVLIFSNIINHRLYIEKTNNLKIFYKHRFKNIHHLCEDKEILYEYIFNYHYKKIFYETINYLLKTLKLDDTRIFFLKCMCDFRRSDLTADEKIKIIRKLIF